MSEASNKRVDNDSKNSGKKGGIKIPLIVAAAVLILIIILLAVLLPKCEKSPERPAGPAGSGEPALSGNTEQPGSDPSGNVDATPGNPVDATPGASIDATHFHTYGEWKTLSEPDCTNPGRRERTCKECGFVQTQDTSPLGHDGHNNECVRCGKKAAEPQVFAISDYINGDGLWITKYSGTNETDLLIPDVVDGKPVVCIAGSAFEGDETIVSVSLPDNVTQIGGFSFGYCPNLRMMHFGRNIMNQYTAGINGCPNVEFLTVEQGNPYLHSDGNCVIETGTKTMVLGCRNSIIPDDGSVLVINSYAFQTCYSITSLTVPSPVTRIETSAFSHCRNLASITIADSVTTIEYDAFRGCDALKEVRLPAHITRLENQLFESCVSLEEIAIPDGVEGIGSSCFESCAALKNVRIPGSVKEINNYAFKNCTSLESIKLPEGLRSLGAAFIGCTALKELAIPENVESLAASALYGCTALKNVTLPKKIDNIPRRFFADCASLEEIVIPEGVTTIDSGAFANCTALKTVTLPATLKYVSEEIFEECTSLATVNFGGTRAQWDALRWDESDDCLKKANVVCK